MMEWELEQSIMDSIIGDVSRYIGYYDNIGHYFIWGRHEFRAGKIIIVFRSGVPDKKQFRLLDERHPRETGRNIRNWSGFSDFQDLIQELRSNEFRNANGLAPLK